jgi:hypothetical protein
LLSAEQVDQFARDGYLIVRNVLTPEEVQTLREEVYGEATGQGLSPEGPSGTFLPGDLSSYPALCGLPLDRRLLEISRQLLGSRPIYFRDSAVNIGGSARAWHKDNRNSDRYEPASPDWNGPYPILRMGLYLEDHTRHSGGVALRVGSHVDSSSLRRSLAKVFWGAVQRVRPGDHIRVLASGMLAAGKPIHAGTRAGDVVVWNLRTTHSAHTLRLKLLKELKLPPAVENRLPSFLTLGEDGERVAVFVTFGAESDHLRRFIDHLVSTPYFPERNLQRPPCAEFLSACEERGDALAFVDPSPSLSEAR